jgi:hypothetical protein
MTFLSWEPAVVKFGVGDMPAALFERSKSWLLRPFVTFGTSADGRFNLISTFANAIRMPKAAPTKPAAMFVAAADSPHYANGLEMIANRAQP